eukprot:788811-Rhodomonas_salina.2
MSVPRTATHKSTHRIAPCPNQYRAARTLPARAPPDAAAVVARRQPASGARCAGLVPNAAAGTKESVPVPQIV